MRVPDRVGGIMGCAGLLVAASLVAPAASAQPRMSYRDTAANVEGLRCWREIHAELRQLAETHPEMTRLLIIGASAEGRPLLALRIADDPEDQERPTVLLSSGQHANEAATPEHVLDAARLFIERAGQEPYATWLGQMALVVLPMVNPDGSHAFWEIDRRLGRKNRRRVAASQIGVDLNRNFPFGWGGPRARFSGTRPESRFYRGPAPSSEPETRAVMRLGKRQRPVAMIAYHSAATRLLVPYSVIGAAQPEPSAAWSVATRIVEALPHVFAKRRFRAVGRLYPVTGVEKDWFHHRFGTLAYVLELPYRRPVGARLAESIEHTRGAWMTLFERWLEGPSLSVRAVDEFGVPIKVDVRLDEVETFAGERRTTDPQHGWFHTYLPGPGRYTVRLAGREREVARPITVTQGWVRIEVEIPPPATLLTAR